MHAKIIDKLLYFSRKIPITEFIESCDSENQKTKTCPLLPLRS